MRTAQSTSDHSLGSSFDKLSLNPSSSFPHVSPRPPAGQLQNQAYPHTEPSHAIIDEPIYESSDEDDFERILRWRDGQERASSISESSGSGVLVERALSPVDEVAEVKVKVEQEPEMKRDQSRGERNTSRASSSTPLQSQPKAKGKSKAKPALAIGGIKTEPTSPRTLGSSKQSPLSSSTSPIQANSKPSRDARRRARKRAEKEALARAARTSSSFSLNQSSSNRSRNPAPASDDGSETSTGSTSSLSEPETITSGETGSGVEGKNGLRSGSDQHSVQSTEDAKSSIEAFFADPAAFLNVKENKLRLWQGLCIEFGVVEPIEDLPDLPIAPRTTTTFARPHQSMPQTLTSAKRLLSERVHVNLVDYVDARESGVTDFGHLLHPSASRMIKDTKKHRKYVKPSSAKAQGLEPLLKDFGYKRARAQVA